MTSSVRFTRETILVVEALAAGHVHGFDIVDATELASGTVYPILRRLDDAGLVRSRWEEPSAARKEHRPPRRYYELNAAGRRYLAEAHTRVPGVARIATTALPRRS